MTKIKMIFHLPTDPMFCVLVETEMQNLDSMTLYSYMYYMYVSEIKNKIIRRLVISLHCCKLGQKTLFFFCNMSGKNGSVGHDFCFLIFCFYSIQTTEMHILAVIMLPH